MKNKCDSCDSSYIQGVYVHEKGCPEAWKNELIECKECGETFIPERKGQTCCSPCCHAAYNGHSCACPSCEDEFFDVDFESDQDF